MTSLSLATDIPRWAWESAHSSIISVFFLYCLARCLGGQLLPIEVCCYCFLNHKIPILAEPEREWRMKTFPLAVEALGPSLPRYIRRRNKEWSNRSRVLLFIISARYLEARSSHPSTYPKDKHVPTGCCSPAGLKYTSQHLNLDCKGCLHSKGSGTLFGEEPVLESELLAGLHSSECPFKGASDLQSHLCESWWFWAEIYCFL